MSLFDQQVALVTGGASGIGRAAALAFAREGAAVVVSDVNDEQGAETVSLIIANGGDALYIRTDVSKAAQVEALIAGTIQTYGRLDCAFNNAGVGGMMGPLQEKTEGEWDSVMNVNLKGVWLCMKYEIPAMLANGGGAIVNMASVAGLLGFAHASIYDASKHGVIGLTKTAAIEQAAKHIRINAVCPGFTDTPMVSTMVEVAPQMGRAVTANPMRRMGKPEEIADAVVYLCSHKASFITGQALALDGGMTIQ
jgi:NAD(P)-dependent dehydrogenase (short-subunit alcohol dehydrogenase family)